MNNKNFLFKSVSFVVLLTILYCSVFFAGKAVVRSVVSYTPQRVFPVIIIDAGHGGIDGGAVAKDGTPEKDINLYIAKKLNDYLNALGYKTIMTRTDDISLESPGAKTIREKKTSDLHNRMLICEENKNSIFISIHQNHFTIEKYWGTQVFYSPNDAFSPLLAQSVQSTVAESIQPENTRQIKKCGPSVYLIHKAVLPAILVECGFLSNYNETEKLKTDEYQTMMAFAVAEGIITCLQNEM